MSDDLFRTLVTQLGREFARRQMPEHVAALREFYARELLGEADGRLWTLEVVLEWCARLQIGPPGNAYLVVHHTLMRCPFCAVRQDGSRPLFQCETSWEGGAKMHCAKCGKRWVQLKD